MPLPAALAARLAKRGLIQVEEPQKKGDVEEEVFAEDYDDLGATAQPSVPSDTEDAEPTEAMEEEEDPDAPAVYEASACPNNWNQFHECVAFCKEHWGNKKFKSDPVNERKRNRMLRKYPLPDGWKEVADPSTGRFYYWNQVTDQVSWLAPLHPRAVLHVSKQPLQDVVAAYGGSVSGDDDAEEEDMEMEDDMADKDFEEIEKEVMQEKRQREKERSQGPGPGPGRGQGPGQGQGRGRSRGDADRDRRKGRGRAKEELDPMDPAAYSDIPRGNWSSGLEARGTAKTGVDATANGPLFQQRPYPSPGAVLRANKQMDSDEEEDL